MSDDALWTRTPAQIPSEYDDQTAEAVHDFRNILNTVFMLSELALTELPETSPACAAVQHIITACSDANDLCNRMMESARHSVRAGKWVNVSTLIKNMTPLLMTYLPHESALRLDLADNTPLANASPCEIRQIVMNLIKNAAEALGNQPGVVTLSTGVIELEVGDVGKRWGRQSLQSGRFSYLAVSDTGCGMDEETMNRLFETSFTTKVDGHGLGTASVRRIVSGCGGIIQVQSYVGIGTQIRVLFPLTQALDPTLAISE